MLNRLIQATGGLGILLLGMVVMTDGLRSLAGESLQRLLGRWTRSPTSGAAIGALATAAVQSSSATTVAAVGFVGAGLLTFPQALGIVFGANVGTTVTGWIVAIAGFKLQLGQAALPLILIGALLRLLASGRAAAVGFALAGFGAILVGIDGLREGLSGLSGTVTPASFPPDTLMGRVALVGIGFAVTAVTQASSAGVVTAMTFLSVGAITFPQAGALVIGMDVGTTLTALIATIGGTLQARRTGAAHVLYNCLTAVAAFWLLPVYIGALNVLAPGTIAREPELCLVGFHTLFNCLGVIAVLPVAGRFAALVERLLPERPAPFTARLDRSLLGTPTVALAAVAPTLLDLFGRARTSIAELARGVGGSAYEQLDLVALALAETRRYLERIKTSSDTPTVYAHHLSIMHVVDHLDRLIDRARERDRIATLRSSRHLRARLAVLTSALALENPEPDLLACWRSLRDSREEDRKEVLGRAARGEIDSTEALAQLDALRWLRRVARHCWRISVHLATSAVEPPAPATTRAPEIDEED